MADASKDNFFFTSESVTGGHPDKLCDFISDSILDACLEQDKNSKVACESCVKNSLCLVAGEISTKAKISYEQIAREAMKSIGYDNLNKGLDHKTATILLAIDQQSPEIANAVHVNKAPEDVGAGDQGLMIGYATDETPELMPCTIIWAHKIVKKLTELRENNTLTWLRPDAKSQITVEYSEKEKGHIEIVGVHTVVISAQHSENVTNEEIKEQLTEQVIKKVIPEKYLNDKTRYIINPSGSFVVGGPMGDAGLTGRKIIVDTYGGWGGHGGGAFSGKDPTKVDRSGAYAARWVAKSLVANGFAKRIMVQISYSIGINYPLSIHIDSYGTAANGLKDSDLVTIVNNNFDLRPGCIIRDLKLDRPIYKKTAMFGHFGQEDPDFTWEAVKDLSKDKK